MSDTKLLNSKNARRRGQALVESALVTLVFLVVFIGILDVGQVMFVHQTMAERSRRAIRYGAVRPYDPIVIQNMFLYDQPTVPGGEEQDDYDRYQQEDGENLVPGLFDLDASMVVVTRQDANTNEDRITLTITNYPFRFYTPFIAGVYRGKTMVMSIPYEGG